MQDRFNSVVEAAPNATVLMSESGRIVYVNAQTEKLFGYSRDELLDEPVEMLLPERFRLGHPELRGGFFSQPAARPMGAGRDLYGRHKDGSEIPIEIGLNPLETDEGKFVLAAIIDISARKRASSVFHVVIEASPNAMVLVNESGRVALINAEAERLFGYSRDELLGQSMELLVPERFRRAHPTLRSHFHAAPTVRPMGAGRDLYGRHKDGSEIPIEIALNPLVTEEGNFVLAAIVNIAERKRTEELRLLNAGMQQHSAKLEALNHELEAASRFKSQFVATMSHELRTPLNAIIGMAELLAKTELDERQNVHVQTINESAEGLLSIINSILDFSKIEAGKMDLRASTFAVEAVVEGAADVLALQARDKGIMLHTYVDPMIPAVSGDADRLRQILLNLISNAVKFTASGSVVVRALPLGPPGHDVVLRFEVQDSGIGIPADVLPQLFQPFVQGDGSSSRRFGGTGLGLSISKRLAELMGGEIGVHSEPGAGSLFWFTSRFGSAPRSVAAQRTFEGTGGLIVTGDDVFAQIVERYLASWNMPSRRAVDAADVREALRSNTLATWVAIVDLDDTGGREMLDAVQALRAAMSYRVVTVGGDGGLMKPLRQSLLFDSIVHAVHVHKPGACAPAETPSSAPGATGPDGRILVAEDNVRLQRLLKLQFDDLGQAVHFVSDGVEAAEALRQDRFAMIFMDCQMPHMDGLAATRTIRGEEKEGDHVPIVAMTANAFAEDREACIAAGMDDYLAKPVKLADLRNMIERWSRRSVRRS